MYRESVARETERKRQNICVVALHFVKRDDTWLYYILYMV